MNLKRFGELSFLEWRNGRLFTELGYDVTEEVLKVFGVASNDFNEQTPVSTQAQPSEPPDKSSPTAADI